jgi:hypothetical protein
VVRATYTRNCRLAKREVKEGKSDGKLLVWGLVQAMFIAKSATGTIFD